MAAVEDQPAALLAMAEVHMVQVEATMAAGMVVVAAADKEVHHMVEDNHTVEVGANKAVVVVAMVSNNNTKVNKVAILDNLHTQMVNKRGDGGTGCSVISRYPIRRESLYLSGRGWKLPKKYQNMVASNIWLQ